MSPDSIFSKAHLCLGGAPNQTSFPAKKNAALRDPHVALCGHHSTTATLAPPHCLCPGACQRPSTLSFSGAMPVHLKGTWNSVLVFISELIQEEKDKLLGGTEGTPELSSTSSHDRPLWFPVFHSWQRSCKSHSTAFSIPALQKYIYVLHLC